MDLSFVYNAIIPCDCIFSLHALVFELAFVGGRSLLVNADVPLAVLECTFEMAVVTAVMVSDLAIGHITILKLALVGCFTVWECEQTLSMALILLIDRAFVCSTVAIAHLLLLQGSHFFSCSFSHTTLFC